MFFSLMFVIAIYLCMACITGFGSRHVQCSHDATCRSLLLSQYNLQSSRAVDAMYLPSKDHASIFPFLVRIYSQVTWFPTEWPHFVNFRFLRGFTIKLYYSLIKLEIQMLLYILQDILKLHGNKSNISRAATTFYKALLELLNPCKALLRCFDNSL